MGPGNEARLYLPNEEVCVPGVEVLHHILWRGCTEPFMESVHEKEGNKTGKAVWLSSGAHKFARAHMLLLLLVSAQSQIVHRHVTSWAWGYIHRLLGLFPDHFPHLVTCCKQWECGCRPGNEASPHCFFFTHAETWGKTRSRTYRQLPSQGYQYHQQCKRSSYKMFLAPLPSIDQFNRYDYTTCSGTDQSFVSLVCIFTVDQQVGLVVWLSELPVTIQSCNISFSAHFYPLQTAEQQSHSYHTQRHILRSPIHTSAVCLINVAHIHSSQQH